MSVQIENEEGNTIIGNFNPKDSVKITFFASHATLIVAPNVYLRGCRIIAGRDSLIVINQGCVLVDTIIRAEQDCKITIGANTSIAKTRLHASEHRMISIGRNCVFKGARFRTSDAHSILAADGVTRINLAKDINIGHFVFIGRDVKIMKGVSIGNHCFIRQSALVSRSFAAQSLISGVPAVLLESGITWKAY